MSGRATPLDLDLYEPRQGAQFSHCGQFRYHYFEEWGEGRTLLMIGLNPSKTNGVFRDQSTKKGARFARILGFTRFEWVNLFAYVATEPADLKAAGYPVGPDNDATIRATVERVVADGGRVCVAWGANVHGLERPREVLAMLAELGAVPHTLKLTKDGYPSHPLYLSSMCKLVRYEAPKEIA